MSDIRALHHTGYTVDDLERSLAFYRDLLGMEEVARQEKRGGYLASIVGYPDAHVRMAHLRVGGTGHMLELFEYADNRELEPLSLARGNDTHQLGVRHVGFRVDDLGRARQALLDAGCAELTDVKHGRTGIDYFFVKDPDGVWVEIVEDRRELDPARPVRLIQGRDTG